MVQRCTGCNLSRRDLQLQKHSGFSDGGLLEPASPPVDVWKWKKLHVAHTSEFEEEFRLPCHFWGIAKVDHSEMVRFLFCLSCSSLLSSFTSSINGILVVWVGGLDSWHPPYEGDCCLGVPLESQTTNPKPPIS